MTSVASSADAGEGRPLAAGMPPRGRLSRFLLILAILLPTAVAVDLSVNNTFGSDVRVNCAAVDAHREGRDPYFVRNLKDTDLSYPYLPVTLDAFRPLCAGGFLVAHYKAIYLVLGLICVLLLPGLGGRRERPRDAVLRGVFALGGFLGFEWVLASGNFAMLSGLLTAASLALLLRPAQSEGHGDASFVPQLAGAALLGLVTSFKLVFVPVLAALYLLPQSRRRKLVLIAVAAGMFALPILVSVVFYPELSSSWLNAILGQIPEQHSPGGEDNPSLLFFAQTLADRVSLADSKPVVAALYGLIAVALLLAPLAVVVWRMVRAQGRGKKISPLRALDDWLLDHPDAAMRITVLAMYALYLCAPRLKVYAFFEAALYAAILIVDLPAMMIAVMLTMAIAIPFAVAVAGVAFVDGFDLLTVAIVCFWIMLWTQSASSAQAVRAAKRLGADGF
ncbi:hypothetical protein [Bradyrhizobium sp. CCGUVB14]|uniref:hypothetical protein n=1 Tax=Bradyrhizobium sp. CCGUVB14 TaxID=2949628 RepID=UPI0020B21541|nr:hypothetical protein [Bradyrhizobium sp. CCGUVB14]MCP3445286.1 hypothetical protein [Bradyrhizobium sp. CCGUVB14]